MPKAPPITWDQQESVAANARLHLPGVVSWYFAFGRQLRAEKIAPSQLHQLRLATKRLRYTLELFRDCYGPGLERYLKPLQHVQQLLGELNDIIAAQRLFKTRKMAGPRSRVTVFLHKRLREKLEQFHRYWNEVFDAPGQEPRWTAHLGRQAHSPSEVSKRTSH